MAGRKILMITSSEHGHANVFVSTAHALFERDPSVELHVASFPYIRPTFESALADLKKDVEPVFHPLPGPTITETLNRSPDPDERMESLNLLEPGFRNTPKIARFYLSYLWRCWTPEEFGNIILELFSIIESVAADVVVVDPLMAPGLTAAKQVRARHQPPRFKLAILSPNTFKEFCMHYFKPADTFVKWPAMCSALPNPVPWYLVPLNIYFLVRLIISLVFDRERAPFIEAVRAKVGLPGLEVENYGSVIAEGLTDFDMACVQSNPAVDFELDTSKVPKDYLGKIVQCGPILRFGKPVAEADPEMSEWMKRGPVVYINLGTICLVSEDEAIDMAQALRELLGKAASAGEKDMRVLWKLKKDLGRSPGFHTDKGSRVYEILREEIEQDRVRIVSWVKTEPSALLRSGNVICAVNHGGASSFFESAVFVFPSILFYADTGRG
jgi:hypothetical protein